jgi:AraC family transcriptional activator of tynA and feaB
MDPNVDRDSDQETPDGAQTTSNPSMTASPIELQSMDYEAWRVLLRSVCGRYSPQGVEPKDFSGSFRPFGIWGCEAVDLSCNARRIERTNRDARLDGRDHFYALVQLAGQSTMIQNDHVVELAAGDVALVDSARPVTFFSGNTPGRWISLDLPRGSVISHLGSEPEGGAYKRAETPASRLLSRLIQDAADEGDPACASPDPYMQLAIYDLLGAIFAKPDLPTISSHTDKLFKRICNIVKDRFADPGFSPRAVAIEAGISLRYLQKLFTARGSSCTHFILSIRLDHAARLLHRRKLLNTRQPISQIAYQSGFSDYTHFARQFRHRFGHPPGVHAAKLNSYQTSK